MKYSFILIFLGFTLYSQDCITINRVFSFKPGEGQNLGQSEEFFPANIFGAPSRIANEQVAEASESEVLSLGFGGEIIVGNSDYLIVDGDGADFTIFENVFLNPVTQRLFKEPAVVSVSKDGKNYTEFPYDFASLEGCAGTHITNGNADYCNPNISGGDSFDLSLIAMDSVRYIKIKDITVRVKDNPNHKYFDFSLSGFDLDAIVIHNFVSEPISDIQTNITKDYHIRSKTIESMESTNQFEIYSLEGRLIAQYYGIGTFRIEVETRGIYLIKIENKSGIAIEKIIII